MGSAVSGSWRSAERCARDVVRKKIRCGPQWTGELLLLGLSSGHIERRRRVLQSASSHGRLWIGVGSSCLSQDCCYGSYVRGGGCCGCGEGREGRGEGGAGG